MCNYPGTIIAVAESNLRDKRECYLNHLKARGWTCCQCGEDRNRMDGCVCPPEGHRMGDCEH
ncbi:uncharacterized protein K489DRAFT_382879 [Dissoconium aciculare CBS 342.82]|uniref:Uncharacterized protein n=1 Tax=Dissoconium aciculare CBS 342.82 TaxID=1314786 RepID=A0A6J3LWH8_9PEZI|nr:uncharacterized protein K489DRAFT_382879 [Dissoconium aciculare CBS 342.82]KAF1820125.1 hypothetical protein K489DRAFT_382879 [Dissoconium aciculare CBS 342.82]